MEYYISWCSTDASLKRCMIWWWASQGLKEGPDTKIDVNVYSRTFELGKRDKHASTLFPSGMVPNFPSFFFVCSYHCYHTLSLKEYSRGPEHFCLPMDGFAHELAPGPNAT